MKTIALLALILPVALLTRPAETGKTGDPAATDSAAAPCVVAKDWVAANMGQLPTSLDAFGKFDFYHRRAIYNALSVDVRVSLWREQLTRKREVGVSQGVLNSQQVAFLERVEEQLPELIGGEATPETDKRLAALQAEAIELFGKLEGFRVLGTLGAEQSTAGAIGGAAEQGAVQCTCWLGGTCARGHVPMECVPTYDHNGLQFYCAPLPFGCGPLWTKPCDGVCGDNLAN